MYLGVDFVSSKGKIKVFKSTEFKSDLLSILKLNYT